MHSHPFHILCSDLYDTDCKQCLASIEATCFHKMDQAKQAIAESAIAKGGYLFIFRM